jgi:hypothetical protein
MLVADPVAHYRGNRKGPKRTHDFPQEERMRRITNRITTPLFALVLATALSFGISTAFARPAAANACFYSPPTALGACSSQAQCQLMCNAYGTNPNSLCTRAGCCVCAF